MFERFGRDVRAAVVAASREAAELRGDRHVGTEHLLVGVAEAGSATIAAAGLTADDLRRALDGLDRLALGLVGVDVDLESVPGPLHPVPPRRRRHIPFTAGAKSSLRRSLHIAIDLGHRRIGSDHLLASLAVGGENDPAVRLLRTAGIDPADVEAHARSALRRSA
jgi:ATP-dependent Clp protease ATP-binding subunit ClpA